MREALSLIGVLSFAAKVVRPGRSFLRRMIDTTWAHCRAHGLQLGRASLSARLILPAEFKADLAWWLAFAADWNGVSVILSAAVSASALLLQTDERQSRRRFL